MSKTKDAVLIPKQKELMEKEYLDFVKPSTYGNKANHDYRTVGNLAYGMACLCL